jgi:hypothetical protein
MTLTSTTIFTASSTAESQTASKGANEMNINSEQPTDTYQRNDKNSDDMSDDTPLNASHKTNEASAKLNKEDVRGREAKQASNGRSTASTNNGVGATETSTSRLLSPSHFIENMLVSFAM